MTSSSAAAFVEGGVQDACEDACSICLESFRDEDPAVVTSCKHEYHLQCILEWSQRSKECPMCWQPLSLKDPISQELLAAVEQERSIRQSRASGLFAPSREGYDFHRLATYGDDSDFEERMMRHLAFVTMGRRQLTRREANAINGRPSFGHMQSQFVIVPAHPGAGHPATNDGVSVPAGSLTLPAANTAISSSMDPTEENSPPTASIGGVSVFNGSGMVEVLPERNRGHSRATENTRKSLESPSFSESFKSRLVAASSRYKESISKTTRSFRDRLRARNPSMADLGARAREVSAGVVRALERISLEPSEAAERDVHETAAHEPSTPVDLVPDNNRSSTIEHSACSVENHENQFTAGNPSGSNPRVNAANPGPSRVAPQPLADEATSSVEQKIVKGAEGNISPVTDGQQIHLIPLIT